MGTQHLRDAPAVHVPRGGLHQGRRPLLQWEVHQQGKSDALFCYKSRHDGVVFFRGGV